MRAAEAVGEGASPFASTALLISLGLVVLCMVLFGLGLAVKLMQDRYWGPAFIDRVPAKLLSLAAIFPLTMAIALGLATTGISLGGTEVPQAKVNEVTGSWEDVLVAAPLCQPPTGGAGEDESYGSAAHLGCVLVKPPGAPKRTVLIVGGTLMRNLELDFVKYANDNQWLLVAATAPGCSVVKAPGEPGDCAAVHEAALKISETRAFDQAIAVDSFAPATQYTDRASGEATALYDAYLSGLQALAANVGTLAVVANIPTLDVPGTTQLRAGSMTNEETVKAFEHEKARTESDRILLVTVNQIPNAILVQATGSICPAGSPPCEVQVDGLNVRENQLTFTRDGAAVLVRDIAKLSWPR